jgi:PAS domain S-box-containing protein
MGAGFVCVRLSMDLENKRLYSSMPWVVTLLITGLFVILLHKELVRQDRDWQQHLLLQQAAAEAAFDIAQQDLLHQAEVFAQMIARDSLVINLVRQAAVVHEREGGSGGAEKSVVLRSQLQQALERYWGQMTSIGFRELNIHLGSKLPVDKTSVFLRANKMERFGDDISPLSPLLVAVLNSGNSTSGMEVRHFGANYRAFVPITANDSPTAQPIGALEVGLALLPLHNPDANQGQAVLVNAALAREVFWGRAQQEAILSTKSLNSPWYVESYNNPLIKEWHSTGLLSNLPTDRSVPWLIHYQDKDYLVGTSRLAGNTASHAPVLVPNAVVLTWADISEERAANSHTQQQLYVHYLVGWIVSLLVLWVLFRLNRRHVLQLLHEHSQQLQKERDLSEQSRQRLNLALVSSESGFWEWNISTNRAFFSKEWRELCGLSNDTGADGTADIEEWLVRVHPSDKRASYTEMIRHIKGETPMFENEYRLKIADGSYKWIFTRGKVVEWLPDGKAALMLGVYTDITERKKNEIIVIRQQAALRALNEIASIPVLDAEEQLSRALEIGSRYLGLPCGTVSRVQGNQYQIKISVGYKCPRPSSGPLSNYFCEFTLRNQDVFACEEISRSEYANHYAIKHMSVDTYIGVPIWLQGKIYGVLSFDSERSRYQVYDDLDKDFMRLLARWVGVTLERWQYQSEQQLLIDKFEKLCDQLPGFLYQFQLNTDGKSFFPFASARIKDVYGVSAEEVKNDAASVFAVLHPEEIGWIGEGISASAANLKNWTATYRVRHPTRGEIWVRGEGRPQRLEDGNTLWHGYIQEVTEEKLAAIKLQDINALREAIFDAASIAIISSNEHGVIKTFNQGAEKLLGYSSSEVVDILMPLQFHLLEETAARAKVLSQEFGTEIAPGIDVFIAKAREGDEDENEWTFVRKDGSHVPVILSITALRSSDGEITGYLGIARDISEIKRIDRMKSEFISTVSHELRTPLTAISGALGIIVNGAAGAIPDTATKMLNIAHKNSLRLIHLVNDLLDMEKLSAGKMHFELKSQTILSIVNQSIDANAAYAAQYNVKLVLNNMVREDLRVNVDAQRLQQVLANFLSNAAKFSPAEEFVELRIETIFNNVRVSVIDKGHGISDEFRNRIFQKFSQADSSDSRQKGGTGLGLAICKEIIERMGGRVGFFSELGKGSQFYFDLPTEENGFLQPSHSSQRVATGERLLVIEDDPEVAELFATMLRVQNYRVDIAYSGQAALERLALYAYKALTMDIELPDINGLELIRQLRSDASTMHLPIIVISANLDSERLANRNSPTFAGVQWLQKPQTTQAIIAAVKAALAN